MRNMTPYMARNTSNMPPLPTLNAGLRKKRMSSIGSSGVELPQHEPGSTAAATPNAARVAGADQPCSGASIRPNTSVEIPTMESSAPSGSSLPCSGSRDLGTKNQPPTSASAITGT